MKTKYTPGPWRKQSGTTYIAVHADAADFTLLLNASPEVGCPRDEQEANAQLIAAAPELLEALERVVRLLETEDAHLANFGEVEAARTAIAKAKGEVHSCPESATKKTHFISRAMKKTACGVPYDGTGTEDFIEVTCGRCNKFIDDAAAESRMLFIK